MNTYKQGEEHGVRSDAACPWVGPALCVVLGLLAACLLVEALPVVVP